MALPTTDGLPSRPWRSVGAVLAGFLVVVVLSTATDGVLHLLQVFPTSGPPMSDGLFLVATGYRTVYTILGGYLTARLAPKRPMSHAMVLAGIGFAAGMIGLVVTWNAMPALGPRWYPVALVLLGVPSVWVGAKLARGPR